MCVSCGKKHCVKFCTINRFNLDQVLGDSDEFVFALTQNVDCSCVGLFDQEGDLPVNFGRCLGADGSAAIWFHFERNVSEGTHTKFTDHAASYIRDILEVLAGTCRNIPENKLFSGTPSHR